MSYRLSSIFLAIVSILAVVLLWLIFYPLTVIRPNIQPYKVLTKEVFRGKQIVYQVDSCKYIDVPSQVTRQFVSVTDMIEYPALSSPNNVGIGCRKTNVSTTVPLFLPEGKYYINLDVSYKVNVMTNKTYHFETETFIVKEATPEGVVK